ncbi:FkbM family methyltransferase [Sphingosinicella terrae]|uniref:FkbM family methyltransferase n=1 Tax=Sphingosinicella terrae TaxID=2172047 RepID=UPI000E0D0823|nr:FkbM family methyltransferase [Sphingosinicella terrae]
MTAWQDMYRKVRGTIPTPARNLGELFLWRESFLRSTGWTRSRREGAAVDVDGDPIPWYTYPAIRFLEDRIPPTTRLFEFGMGNSTLWWSRKAKQIITCEGDQGWFDRIASQMPDNVEALLIPDSDSYVRAAVDRGGPFDIVVVDGRRRVRCCRNSLPVISQAGVVIWDDFHRPYYHEGRAFLAEAGYRELPFWGMTPITARESCTSIFYRTGNLLGI